MNYQPCNPGVDPVLLFEEVDGDRKRGRGGGSSESRRESVGHVGDEPEKKKHQIFLIGVNFNDETFVVKNMIMNTNKHYFCRIK
jgi:hypothetical protein